MLPRPGTAAAVDSGSTRGCSTGDADFDDLGRMLAGTMLSGRAGFIVSFVAGRLPSGVLFEDVPCGFPGGRQHVVGIMRD